MHVPKKILIIAGQGRYPLHAVHGARAAGVRHIHLMAFRGQTDRRLARLADDVAWLRVGQFGKFLDVARRIAIPEAIMVGQITPACLFHARFDRLAREELRALPVKSAHSLFGRITQLLAATGVTMLPASMFMGANIPAAGVLTHRPPDAREESDIERGLAAALAVGDHDVGQTVVIKQGMVVAVEAFEGTNRAILRGARFGGRGCVVVKTARRGHDMRFDIPVIGVRTIHVMRRARATALAVHAGRAILLDRDALVALADRYGMSLRVAPTDLPPAPVVS